MCKVMWTFWKTFTNNILMDFSCLGSIQSKYIICILEHNSYGKMGSIIKRNKSNIYIIKNYEEKSVFKILIL